MAGPLDETSLAARLCGELLTATQVKALCLARGFPVTVGAKEVLASAAAARFLDPVGVAEAMAGLDPVWLKALHVIAACNEPLGLSALRGLVEPGGPRWRPDWRELWRKAASGLVCKGVVLVVEASEPRGNASRFAGLSLVLPLAFRRFLPPFPVDAVRVSGAGRTGAMDDVLRNALEAFASRTATNGKAVPRTVAERVAAKLSLEGGVLGLRGGGAPTAERLARVVVDAWRESLATRGGSESALSAGTVAHHILAHVADGFGCAPAAMAGALSELGLAAKTEDVAEFLEEGYRAGLLGRHGRSGAPPLFRLAARPSLPESTPFELNSDQARGCMAATSCALLPLLEAAVVSSVSLERGRIVLEPDPIRMGRAWRELPAAIAAGLRASSRAFDDAARLVEERSGQVTVHLALSVLRVEDAGLRVLLRKQFPSAVRELEGPYLACLTDSVERLVAAAKKEGFLARRLS